MKKSLLPLLLVFITSSVFSQMDFDFTSYKFRYQKYKGIDLGFHLNQSYNESELFSFNSKNNSFSFNGTASYFSFVNSGRLYRKVVAGYFPKFTSSTGSKSVSFTNDVSFGAISRYYLREKRFCGFEFSLNDYYLYNKNSNTKKYNTTSPFLFFTYGKGREEYISDAITSIRLFEELKSRQLLISEVTNENVLELSAIIVKFNNRRVLDDRINRIAMIEALIKYLQESNLIKECSPSVFAVLNDQIYFAPQIMRSCGRVKQLKAGMGFSSQASNMTTDSSRTTGLSLNFSPQIIYSITNSNVINLNNQLNTGIEFILENNIITNKSTYTYDTINNKSTDKRNQISPEMGLFIERGYYPNTRTSIVWKNSLVCYMGTIISPANYNPSMDIRFSSMLSIYFYVSPQFRIILNEYLYSSSHASFRSNSFPQNNSRVSNNFNLALSYALF